MLVSLNSLLSECPKGFVVETIDRSALGLYGHCAELENDFLPFSPLLKAYVDELIATP